MKERKATDNDRHCLSLSLSWVDDERRQKESGKKKIEYREKVNQAISFRFLLVSTLDLF